jgi:hypothetical protein
MQRDTPTSTDLRPSRRTVTRAAAWSVPVVAAATAAPAYAASCATVRVTANNVTTYNRVSAVQWTATFDYDGTGPLLSNVLTAKATYDTGIAVRNDANTAAGGANDNFTVQNPVGGLGTYGLVMAQRVSGSTGAPAAFGHYAFSFSRAVSNLSFTLTDIDSTTGDFWDSVWLTPGFAVSNPAAGLQGDGSAGKPLKQKTGNSGVDNASGGAGNVTITYAGPISSFTVNYSNAQTGSFTADPDQVVTIANFAFDYRPC